MAAPQRRVHMAGTYFITSRTWESRKLFLKPPVCEVVIETLLHYRDKGSYLLHSFVLMADHVHLILTPGTDISLERAVQLVKDGSARRISQTLNYMFPVWQRGYTDHRIRDQGDYEEHVRYIDANPVKAGLVLAAQEYAWCSACGSFAIDEPPQGLKPLRKGETVGTVETVPLRESNRRAGQENQEAAWAEGIARRVENLDSGKTKAVPRSKARSTPRRIFMRC